MGSTASKPEQPKVFLPKTPTEFSPSLISKLDSSLESDYTRAQYTENHIQERIKQELQKIQKESSESLKEALDKLTLLAEKKGSNKDGKDSISLKHKLEELKSKLDARPSRLQVDPPVMTSKEALVNCIVDNKDRPLNCWDEVEAFKNQIRAFEQKLQD